MTKNVIVVRTLPSVNQVQTMVVRDPMLLRVVISKSGSVVKAPRLRLRKVQAIFTRRDVACIVISQGQKESVLMFDKRRFVQPSFIVDRQLITVFQVSELLSIKLAPANGDAVLRGFRLLEINGQQHLTVLQVPSLNAART